MRGAPPAPFVEQAVVAGPNGATITRPRSHNATAGVVLVPGWGAFDRNGRIGPNQPLRDIALGLAERGIAVLRYDARETTGAVTTSIDDAVAGFDALAQAPRVRSDSVFLLGHSLGGTIMPRIAARCPTARGYIIAAGSTQALEQSVRSQLAYVSALDGAITDDERRVLTKLDAQITTLQQLTAAPPQPAANALPLALDATFWLDLRRHPNDRALAQDHRPLLVLHAGRDYQVTERYFTGWQRAIRNQPNAMFIRYASLNHLFIPGSGPASPTEYQRPGRVPALVIDDIAAWIDAH